MEQERLGNLGKFCVRNITNGSVPDYSIGGKISGRLLTHFHQSRTLLAAALFQVIFR